MSLQDQERIIDEFIERNFVSHNLCAIAAIHEGKNIEDPKRNNPHVHIIVLTRTVDQDGFCKKKEREWDKKEYITIWRDEWANIQNKSYERNGMDIRVSPLSLEVQGIRDREPTIHLSRIDWQRELNGERTIAGNRKRTIKERNKKRSRQRQLEIEREYELELSR